MRLNEQKLKEAREMQKDILNRLYGEVKGIESALDFIPSLFIITRKNIKEEKNKLYIYIKQFERLKIKDDAKVEYDDIPITSKTEYGRCLTDYERKLSEEIIDTFRYKIGYMGLLQKLYGAIPKEE